MVDKSNSLLGINAMVTAGPTYEEIDPVRYIGNYSTGKMGFALAAALVKRGANVTLVTGPTQLTINHPNISVMHVVSAQQMYECCLDFFPVSELTIFSAAVADYRPAKKSNEKIKKTGDCLTLELVKNVDIAKELGRLKKPGQVTVGFALETENEKKHASQKLYSKNLDMIILNSLKDPGAGFQQDSNKISILTRSGSFIDYELKSKHEVAEDITNQILSAYELRLMDHIRLG